MLFIEIIGTLTMVFLMALFALTTVAVGWLLWVLVRKEEDAE